jgi:hypothetical protein
MVQVPMHAFDVYQQDPDSRIVASGATKPQVGSSQGHVLLAIIISACACRTSALLTFKVEDGGFSHEQGAHDFAGCSAYHENALSRS